MIWLRSIRDVAAEFIGAVTATLYPLDAQVRVTETQEVPMSDAPKFVIPVEFDFTEARKQLAEFCGQRFVIGFDGSRSSTEFVMTQPPPRDLLIEDQLRPNYYEDARLVDIVAQFGYMEYSRGFELGSTPKPDDWTELTDITKNSWRRAAREQLKEMNV